MADEKISQMTEDGTLAETAYFPYVDPDEAADADKNKRVLLPDLSNAVGGGPRITGSATRYNTANTGFSPFLFRGAGVNFTPAWNQWYAVLQYIIGGYTPTTVSLQNVVTAADATSHVYIGIFNFAADGMPGTQAAEWGPFDTSSTGRISLTGQTTAMPSSGFYYFGLLADRQATETQPIIESFDVTLSLVSATDERNDALKSTTVTGASGDDLSSDSFDVGRFTYSPNVSMEL